MMTTETYQEKTSAVQFDTATRVHVALVVSELERSLPFYRVLFNQEPTKLRPGYAKFEVANPPVNFTLNEHQLEPGKGALSHMGIQVKSTREVQEAKARFEESSLVTFNEENVTCCYAVQDKVWVTDPDGNSWEVFVVLEADADVHSIQQVGGMDACACDFTGAKTTTNVIKSIPLATASTSCC